MESRRPLNSFRETTRAFLIRVWIEPREIENGSVIWRGMVRIVGEPRAEGGKGQVASLPVQAYFVTLEELQHFLVNHLLEFGIPEDELRLRR
jgi:hypothetical protein